MSDTDDPRPNSPADVGYVDQEQRPAPKRHDPKTCRSCGAAIFWAKNDKTGRSMPVDAEPTENGNVQLYDRNGSVIAKSLNKDDAKRIRDAAWALQAKHTLRLAHHVTCPQRDNWKGT